ncbi:MAG: type VI secretion system domain-containing protein, partial [Betaproteobacteria bacterium]|nr:type VI secretion system domain-containing protein [Betaproteobacteria bacterium]
AGAPPQNQADADKALDGALRRIGEVAGFLLDADLSNPLAYRLSRIALWSRIESLPQAAANKSRVPPPPAQVASTLATMLDKGDRESLVKFAESRLPEFIFWLDLSRVTAEALDGLGSRFVVARNTVAHETASFVRRLAGIEGLTFSDGTPYANADTQNWLRGLLAGEAMGAVEPPGDGDDREGLTAALTEAGKQVEQGNWIEAAARLQSQLASGMSAKSRLMARIRFCQMMVAHKKVKDMRPFLKPLLEEIDRRDLDSWDPALALHALKVIYLGLAGAPSGDGDLPQANDVLRRIALLDYAEALRLSGV